jgi:dihydroorotate dehydrogenase
MFGLLKLGQPLLFALDPETAHGVSITALRSGLPVAARPAEDARLRVTVAGIDFPNPLGMAAGYDKNGEAPDALLRLGFGFAEVGTVTPLPQTGNPKPRIFRLMRDNAVINRLGFDYEAGVRAFARHASYLTVNISSPNTPGLRALQSREALSELLGRVLAARTGTGAATPVFLKIAPDLIDAELDDIAAELLDRKLDGLIVSNTTLSRKGLTSPDHAAEAGGLSGAPLFRRSTVMLARMRQRLGPAFPLIGVGGVDSAETAIEKIKAGADLVQLYTSMIYAGPSLPGRIVTGMARFAAREGLNSIREIRDSGTERWAGQAVD